MNRFIGVIFGTLVLLIAIFVILLCAGFAAMLLTDELESLVDLFPKESSDRHRLALSLFGIAAATATALFTTGIGLLAAYRTYRRTSADAARAQRKQHTINILMQTRLSEYFQTTNKLRKDVFPTDTDIHLSDWLEARASTERREGAEALQQLLNYYEFLAVGIDQGDLDEHLLKSSIRGIMCNLVDDARFMIAELRQNDPKTLEHLVQLYERWREEGINYAGSTSERPIPTEADLRERDHLRANAP